jgi:phospholipid/cholesterol/gamma-HCH transport system permease protein
MSRFREVLFHLGGWSLLVLQCLRELVRPPIEVRRTIYEIDQVGVRSLNIVCLTALFTGMVLALQSAYGLSAFGAKLYVGEIVSLSLVREMGPVLTALMVGGRVGAGMTAELGTMAVTEQVDAIRVLGASPIRKLVLPKVMATVIMLPLLTMLADAVGILGGMIVSL